MKSIYSCLSLVVLISYLRGMENEKLAYCTNQHIVPIYVDTNYISTSSSYPIELKPIFIKTHANIPSHPTQRVEEKPLLSTKTTKKIIHGDPQAMSNLYAKVYNFISGWCLDYERTSKLDPLRTLLKYNTLFDEQSFDCIGHRLVRIIKEMNNAKEKNGLTEDIMGKYSYETKEYLAPVKTSNNYIALFFTLLKKYNQHVLTTKETLPFAEHTYYILSTLSPETLYQQYNPSNSTSSIMSSTYADQYPAFFELVENLHYMLQEPREHIIHSIVSLFYESYNVPEKNTSPSSLSLPQFYQQGYEIFNSYKAYTELHKLLEMIEKTRTSTSISYEQQLAEKMRTFTPSALEIITHTFLWNKDILTDSTKNYISMLFTLIKEYNTHKCYKVTPSLKQYLAYIFKERLTLPFPDGYNGHAFDTQTYALHEFCCLMRKVDLLKQSFHITQHHNG